MGLMDLDCLVLLKTLITYMRRSAGVMVMFGNLRRYLARSSVFDTYASEFRVCRASHSLVTPGDVYLGQDQNVY